MVQAGSSSLTPSIVFEDAAEGVRWLGDVLGFEEAHVFHGPAGEVVFAELHGRGTPSSSPLVRRATGHTRIDRRGNPWAAVGPMSISLAVEAPAEVDAIYERAIARGAEVVRPLFLSRTPLFPDGSHQFDLRDPGRNLWTVGTYRPMPQ